MACSDQTIFHKGIPCSVSTLQGRFSFFFFFFFFFFFLSLGSSFFASDGKLINANSVEVDSLTLSVFLSFFLWPSRGLY